ncbi:hypothetical protein M569_10259, partial [Genlisea aurea]
KTGYLVPLNDDLEEEASIPTISLTDEISYVGRDSIPEVDRRLSRRHLSINVLADTSASILVEGSNPVVLRSSNGRKKLSSGQKSTIQPGDVIEMLPGQYFFKYVPVSHCNGERSPKIDLQKSWLKGEEEEEEKTGKLRSSFRLLRVKGLPGWANSNAVSITDVIQGDVLVAVISNYMVDTDWLLSECPRLKKVPHVLVIHGEGDGALEYMKRSKPSNWILHKPPLPISYGTHHSKAMFLVYPRGIRVVIHTANMIYADWNNKTQGLWMQDFPWKKKDHNGGCCEFENDLVDYLRTLKCPEFDIDLPAIGRFSLNAKFFNKFDYQAATVRLVASVPGYHSGSSLRKWGHMKLRSILQDCTFDDRFEKSPLIYQFSSLGSVDEKWMNELASSMLAGTAENKNPLGTGKASIIWPTVEDVRCSLEGYAAGNSIPSPQKNVEKAFLNKYWSKWRARHTGRCRAMPHIKTFCRYDGQNLAWLLLTSSNLSKAAWGALQKNGSQLMIRSYEVPYSF